MVSKGPESLSPGRGRLNSTGLRADDPGMQKIQPAKALVGAARVVLIFAFLLALGLLIYTQLTGRPNFILEF